MRSPRPATSAPAIACLHGLTDSDFSQRTATYGPSPDATVDRRRYALRRRSAFVRGTGHRVGMIACHPRRQQLRHLEHAALRGAVAVVALSAAVMVAGAGDPRLALALLVLSGALAAACRRAVHLAARSRVGAESEAEVRRALKPLSREGWRVRHAVDWPGGGDLDHVVRAPSGVSFV